MTAVLPYRDIDQAGKGALLMKLTIAVSNKSGCSMIAKCEAFLITKSLLLLHDSAMALASAIGVALSSAPVISNISVSISGSFSTILKSLTAIVAPIYPQQNRSSELLAYSPQLLCCHP